MSKALVKPTKPLPAPGQTRGLTSREMRDIREQGCSVSSSTVVMSDGTLATRQGAIHPLVALGPYEAGQENSTQPPTADGTPTRPFTSAQQLLMDRLGEGWMLHFERMVRPPLRLQESQKPFRVQRNTVESLEARGLIEFTFSTDYWSLTEAGKAAVAAKLQS